MRRLRTGRRGMAAVALTLTLGMTLAACSAVCDPRLPRFARLLDAGFRLIQAKTKSHDHPTRPIQRLCGFPATQDHKIVRVGDHMSLALLSPLGVPPIDPIRGLLR